MAENVCAGMVLKAETHKKKKKSSLALVPYTCMKRNSCSESTIVFSRYNRKKKKKTKIARLHPRPKRNHTVNNLRYFLLFRTDSERRGVPHCVIPSSYHTRNADIQRVHTLMSYR